MGWLDSPSADVHRAHSCGCIWLATGTDSMGPAETAGMVGSLFEESFTLGFFRLWQSGLCPKRGKAGTIGPLKAHAPRLVQHDFICILLVRATPKPSSDAEWKRAVQLTTSWHHLWNPVHFIPMSYFLNQITHPSALASTSLRLPVPDLSIFPAPS